MKYEVLNQTFKEILEIETSMNNKYVEIIKETKNKKIKDVLELIMHDEEKHMKNVEEILKIIK
jgi:rubrerythrin